MGQKVLEKNRNKRQSRNGESFYKKLTPEDVVELGRSYQGFDSPINLRFDIMTETTLPSLEWINFNIPPKLMKISNSGTTAILSAKWHGPRPYVTDGPLSGAYVFSQLHFHWGRSFEEGSEHTFNGVSFPLEVHVMFFKNLYLSQEEAMRKLDGTITIAYFFTLQEEDNKEMKLITEALGDVQDPLTSVAVDLIPLSRLVPPFKDDYFMYWGSVGERSILWFICRRPLGISTDQLSKFHAMVGSSNLPILKNFRDLKDLNNRIVYHVNPSNDRTNLILPHRWDQRRNSDRRKRKSIDTEKEKPDMIVRTLQYEVTQLDNMAMKKNYQDNEVSAKKSKSITDDQLASKVNDNGGKLHGNKIVIDRKTLKVHPEGGEEQKRTKSQKGSREKVEIDRKDKLKIDEMKSSPTGTKLRKKTQRETPKGEWLNEILQESKKNPLKVLDRLHEIPKDEEHISVIRNVLKMTLESIEGKAVTKEKDNMSKGKDSRPREKDTQPKEKDNDCKEKEHYQREKELISKQKEHYFKEKELHPKQKELHPKQKEHYLKEKESYSKEKEVYPKEKEIHPKEQGLYPNPKEKEHTTKEKEHYLKEKESNHREKEVYSKEKELCPKEKELYPKEKELYPKEKELYPKEKVLYPKEKELYPKEKEYCPKQKEHSPKEKEFYPKEKEHCPKQKEHSPKEKEHYHKEKEPSSKEKEHNPKEKDHCHKDKEHYPNEKEHCLKEREHLPEENEKRTIKEEIQVEDVSEDPVTLSKTECNWQDPSRNTVQPVPLRTLLQNYSSTLSAQSTNESSCDSVRPQIERTTLQEPPGLPPSGKPPVRPSLCIGRKTGSMSGRGSRGGSREGPRPVHGQAKRPASSGAPRKLLPAKHLPQNSENSEVFFGYGGKSSESSKIHTKEYSKDLAESRHPPRHPYPPPTMEGEARHPARPPYPPPTMEGETRHPARPPNPPPTKEGEARHPARPPYPPPTVEAEVRYPIRTSYPPPTMEEEARLPERPPYPTTLSMEDEARLTAQPPFPPPTVEILKVAVPEPTYTEPAIRKPTSPSHKLKKKVSVSFTGRLPKIQPRTVVEVHETKDRREIISAEYDIRSREDLERKKSFVEEHFKERKKDGDSEVDKWKSSGVEDLFPVNRRNSTGSSLLRSLIQGCHQATLSRGSSRASRCRTDRSNPRPVWRY